MKHAYERDMSTHEAASLEGQFTSGPMGKQPTEAELTFYRNMTGEEWTATVAAGRQKIADIESETVAAVDAIEQGQAARWERRIRALESIQPSGSPAEDAETFLSAIGLDPSKLGPYEQPYREGNNSVMLRYFREIDKQSGQQLPHFLSEAAQKYFRVFEHVVNKIIAAAEEAGVKP